MDQHLSAALWVGAMLIGFMIGWPVGAAILAAITIVAISQQLTGYRPSGQLQPPPEPSPGPPHHHYITDGVVKIFDQPMKQVTKIETKAITDRTKRR